LLIVVVAAQVMWINLSRTFIHKEAYNWWDRPDYKSKNANKVNTGKELDPFFNVYAWYMYSKNMIGYLLAVTCLGTPNTMLSMTSYEFLTSKIMRWRLFYDKNGQQHGLVTNKHMVRSILLMPDEGDRDFDAWYVGNGNANGFQIRSEDDGLFESGTKSLYLTTKYPAKFIRVQCGDPKAVNCTKGCTECAPNWQQQDKGLDTCCFQFYRQAHSENGAYDVQTSLQTTYYASGLWPDPLDRTSWQGVIYDWLNYDNDGKRLVAENEGFYYPYFRGDQASQGTQYDNWWSRKDNFLGRMQISPQSPLVLFFLNNMYSHTAANQSDGQDNQEAGDVHSFVNLVAAPSNLPGGWVAFCRGMEGKNAKGQEMTSDAMATYVWSVLDMQQPKTMPNCPPPPNPWGIIGGIVAGVMGAALCVLLPPVGEAIIGAEAACAPLGGVAMAESLGMTASSAGATMAAGSQVVGAVCQVGSTALNTVAAYIPPGGSCQHGSVRGTNNG
jgi:hypothetical protein